MAFYEVCTTESCHHNRIVFEEISLLPALTWSIGMKEEFKTKHVRGMQIFSDFYYEDIKL